MSNRDEKRSAERQRVRPYAMTGGRTEPAHADLEMEALVSTIPTGARSPKLTVEQRAIAALCRDILSVAEISARLDLPLGVTRVLVCDMEDDGFVSVHRPSRAADHGPDLELLERVLFRLRNL
jgi:Protein of unknown function (DUF742)